MDVQPALGDVLGERSLELGHHRLGANGPVAALVCELHRGFALRRPPEERVEPVQREEVAVELDLEGVRTLHAPSLSCPLAGALAQRVASGRLPRRSEPSPLM